MSALANPVMQHEVNFGGSLTWRTRCYRPASEAEVLDILARHATGRIRVLGSKHSWSDIAVSGEVSLDMSLFDDVQPLQRIGMLDELRAHRGRYVHHYPLTFRRVLPEDTLISMAASVDEPIYSVSLFTYDPPARREPYYEFCSVLARILLRLVDARLHWGKHFPLQYADIAALYPEMETFRKLSSRNDPRSVFRNDYTKRVSGLEPGGLE